jgi:hypothetical protein
MNKNFAPITDAINALINSIADVHKSILADANEQRREMIELRKRMKDTQMDLSDLSGILHDTVTQMTAVSAVADEIEEKIGDALSDPDMLPTCDYEELAGFCDECGASVSISDNYVDEGDYLLCEECGDLYDEEDEDELFEEDDEVTENVVE